MIKKALKSVYLDHAATTPLRPEVLLAMKPFLAQQFGNPSSLYSLGVGASRAIEQARATIAKCLQAHPDEIIFTSGGTESCNLAVLGAARALKDKGRHIITTNFEHHAVLNSCKALEQEGFTVTYLPVDSQGFISVDQVKKALRPDTILVSIMYANNEIGTILPLAEIGKMMLRYRKERGTVFPYFHSDACQALNYLDCSVEHLHVDLLSLNAGKIYGPKGTGCLFKRRDVVLQPLMYGGSQESYLRPGTENVVGIVGFGKAVELVLKEQEKEVKRLSKLTEYLYLSLKKALPHGIFNGPEIGQNRLANNINFTIPGMEAETILLYLDRHGIMASTGSACTVRSVDTSHVLKAIGRTDAEAKGSLRFTLGKATKKEDISYAKAKLEQILKLFL
jgi:cysteine desulfurase